MYAGEYVYEEKRSFMKITIFSHADHFLFEQDIYSYAPYTKEMNFWIQKFTDVRVVAPLIHNEPGIIDGKYVHKRIHFVRIPKLHFKGVSIFKSLLDGLKVLMISYKEMRDTDHIHLRCPGNVGMLSMMISSLFPSKPKTIKYAGNWDPKSNQPFSYKFQKWWLSNTFLTQNAKVLVYGKWTNQSRNIKPFFTASFSESEKNLLKKEFKLPFQILFCGSLTNGKQPIFAIKICQKLFEEGINLHLDIYGDGPEKVKLNKYIKRNRLHRIVKVHGNQTQEVLKKSYIKAHFVLLPSKSEGWPKVLAEGMFFGCIPIATKISCVPWMLNYGNQGILIDDDLDSAVREIKFHLEKKEGLSNFSENAKDWSQEFTIEKFEQEIQKQL